MPAISKLFLPPPALAGCIMAGIYRDTRGVRLNAADRVNHFPATPLGSVSLILEGQLHVIPPGQDWRMAQRVPPLAQLIATGPQSRPVSSWAPGEVAALTIGIYPDAWRALGGDADWSQIPPELDHALSRFSKTADPTEAWSALCDDLAPVWGRARHPSWHRARHISDWVSAMAARAAMSGTGQSIRSYERWLKRNSGHTRRTLEFFGAIERLHAASVAAGDRPLAEIALDAGYSDQSHMGRAVRRATGFSPARLNKAIECEEPFWCYRLLGERF